MGDSGLQRYTAGTAAPLGMEVLQRKVSPDADMYLGIR